MNVLIHALLILIELEIIVILPSQQILNVIQLSNVNVNINIILLILIQIKKSIIVSNQELNAQMDMTIILIINAEIVHYALPKK